MPLAGFEPAIPASERLQTGIDSRKFTFINSEKKQIKGKTFVPNL